MVLVSKVANMRSRPGSTVQSGMGKRTTRLRLPAAVTARSSASGPGAPARSIAFTSWWAASQGAISATSPVSTFTTPAGTWAAASASANATESSGWRSLATSTAVLPLTITGAITLTRPSSALSGGASTAVTPTGSGSETVPNGPATGLTVPRTWVILSAQPAYQIQRSTAASTSAWAASGVLPAARQTWVANWARWSSSTSATWYSAWPR